MVIFQWICRNLDRGERFRLGVFFAAIALLHLAGWGLLLSESAGYSALLGLGGLAYSFGLRHAFDADHISAIDNTTRKLLGQGRKPMGVGFFFSLGHSTVVFLIALGLGFAAQWVVGGVVDENAPLKSLGGLIGTGVSGAFLMVIGIVNLVLLADMMTTYHRMRRGQLDGEGLEEQLTSGGALTRLFGRLFRLITASWQMYPVGFLFGLGFDTATEVALLAISAGAAVQGLPFLTVVSLPVIFAAGMSLMDTADGVFMAKAYSWAFSHPVRKLFYNLTVTAMSVFVALALGGVELLQLLIRLLDLKGSIFDAISSLNLADIGFLIVGAFVLAWIVAAAYFRVRHLEHRWGAGVVDRQ